MQRSSWSVCINREVEERRNLESIPIIIIESVLAVTDILGNMSKETGKLLYIVFLYTKI